MRVGRRRLPRSVMEGEMAGITKVERERRQNWMDECEHWHLVQGPWRWYPTKNATARRVECDRCPFWFVEELSDVEEQDAYYAGLAAKVVSGVVPLGDASREPQPSVRHAISREEYQL